MTGAGNDFIVIDNRFYHFSNVELAQLAQRLCLRRYSVGADGLLAFSTPASLTHHFSMVYFNADGSRGTMCGNGARCLVRYARISGINAAEMFFESDAGLYRAHVQDDPDEAIRIILPPFKAFDPNVSTAKVEGLEIPAHYIWTGTEHLVCFVPTVSETPVDRWGRALRQDPVFAPAGVNVNFVEVRDPGTEMKHATLKMRTFEKGVEGETLACGTGATAAALVARLLDQVRSNTVVVEMPGGTLTIGFELTQGRASNLYMEGPAESVFRGTLEM